MKLFLINHFFLSLDFSTLIRVDSSLSSSSKTQLCFFGFFLTTSGSGVDG
jgi:hypothetical protein